MKFECVAYDRSGKRVDEVVDAKSAAEAQDELVRKGYYVTEVSRRRAIAAAPRRAPTKGSPLHALSAGKRTRHVAEFCRQLSVLTSTGTPVVEALGAIARQCSDSAFATVVDQVRHDVEEGGTLADAMRKHPAQFDAVAISLIAAGESGGGLDEMLSRLSRLTRQQQVVRAQIVGAMVYPTLLVTIATTVLTIMIVFVIPRFEEMFDSLDAPLPPSTAVLMEVSLFLRAYWWAIVPALLAGAVGLAFGACSARGRDLLDTAAIRVPKLGDVTRSLAMGRIARVLGVLMTSRVPMLEAVELTERSMTNRHYRELLADIHAGITEGESISAVITRSPLVTPSFAEAIRNGEGSGRVGEVLLAMADYMDEDNSILIKSISAIIEPVILLALGILVGFLAVSMFLPLFDVTSAVGPPA